MPRLDEQAHRDLAVQRRVLDRHGSAVREQRALADAKFVALGMTAEVVVIVEDENARRAPAGRGDRCFSATSFPSTCWR